MPKSKANQNESEDLLMEENVNVEGQDNVDVQVEDNDDNKTNNNTTKKTNDTTNKKPITDFQNTTRSSGEMRNIGDEKNTQSFFELGKERYAEIARGEPNQVEFGTKQELQKVKIEEPATDTQSDEPNESQKTYELTQGKELYPQYIADNNEIQRDDIMFEELGKNLELTKEMNEAAAEEQKKKQEEAQKQSKK
jgi:hypothetical protein